MSRSVAHRWSATRARDASRSVPRWWLKPALVVLVGALSSLPPVAAEWQVGTARVDITPVEPMWMSGYASRERPAEGQRHPLWAKALALGPGTSDGEPPSPERTVVLVTLDLVGLDRETAGRISAGVAEQHRVPRANLALCSSHTHTGPVVGSNLGSMYFLSQAQARQVRGYTEELIEQVVELVGRALAARRPCRLVHGADAATFAVNRRNNPEDQVPQRRRDGTLAGPVDHDVPVLAAFDRADRLVALVCGYACHATTLSDYEWSGDYPGFAQLELERQHPEALALFWAGCGADQNPIPRRTAEHAADYGRQLAAAVGRALAGSLVEIRPELATHYAETELAYAQLPSREQLETDAASADRYVASRARQLLAQVEAGHPLSPTYPYPVQAWRLGSDLLWFHLGGEVVVDYALGTKARFDGDRTWVTAYANDVMAYIPSRRVLDEGGYEGGGAMLYYGLPSPWAGDVESRLQAAIDRAAKAVAISPREPATRAP